METPRKYLDVYADEKKSSAINGFKPVLRYCLFFLYFGYSFVTFAIIYNHTHILSLFSFNKTIKALLNAYLFLFLIRISGKFKFISLLYISFIITLHLSFYYYYHSELTTGALASAFESDAEEITGFFLHVGILPLALFLALSAITAFLAPKPEGCRWWEPLVVLCILTFLVTYPNREVFTEGTKESWELKLSPFSMLTSCFDHVLLLSDLMKTADYFYEEHQTLAQARQQRRLAPGISLTPDRHTPQKIIFVIGESAAKSHYGIYGYAFGTDFNLQNLAGDPSRFLVVRNAIASAPITRESLVRMLTFASPLDEKPFYDYFNIVEMAKNAGYETAWLSNQHEFGIHSTKPRIVASSANEKFSNSSSGLDAEHNGMDSTLLEVVKEKLSGEKKQFIVVHLAGSHMAYELHHDDRDFAMARRSPDAVRHYDATVHQTDRTLGGIITLLRTYENSIMYYVPDHGEIVNEGHGFHKLDRQQYEIPVVVWSSGYFLTVTKRLLDLYSSPKSHYFNTTNIPYMLSEIFGYTFDDPTKIKALNEGEYIFNVDGNPYNISELH